MKCQQCKEYLILCIFQISSVESDADLQRVFAFDEIQSLVYETGKRRPLPGIKLEDKKDFISTLISYFSMIRVKAAMDQFCFGLQSLNLYQEIKFDPLVWDKFFDCN